MSDKLVSLGASPAARRLVSAVGVNLPPKLERDAGPWKARPLEGRSVAVVLTGGAELADAIAGALAPAGASPVVVGGDPAAFRAAGEAWGRPPRSMAPDPEEGEKKHYAVIIDATGLRSVAALKDLLMLARPRVRHLKSSGRVVVLGRPPQEQKTVAGAAAQRALEGFTRSLAREVGRKGSTANLLTVSPGAEDRLAAALRFLASPRSVYVSGQPLTLTKSVRPAASVYTRPLDGKVALVTGAARGIGAATARSLAREGAKVIVLDRPGEEAHTSAVAAAVGGVQLMVDMAAPDAGETINAFVQERFGGLDILVHNAGVTRDKTFARMREDQWDLCLDVNLAAVLDVTEALTDSLNSYARVICLSSIAGIGGNVGQTNYAASKAGVIGFVAAIAPRLARRGIAVNAVAPGFIETRLTDAIPVATREVARRLPNLSQGGLPSDVAEVITFFASPGACGLTGQVLRVCGGNLMGA